MESAFNFDLGVDDGLNFLEGDSDLMNVLNEFDLDMLFTSWTPETEPQSSATSEPAQPDSNLAKSNPSTSTNNRRPTFISVNETEKENFVLGMKNKNTVKKTESTVRQFERWLSAPPRNETREPHQLQCAELDNYIGLFILSIRKADGSDYEPDTLTSYHRGIDRYLRDKKYPFSITQDREFAASRAVLLSKRKELKEKGKGNRPNSADPISPAEEQILKDAKCLGNDSPLQLQNKMWYNNTVLFGLRGGTENHKLRWGDISLNRDVEGREYLEYNERMTKTRTGEKSDNRAFKPKQYAHLDEDPENCPVFAYKQFAQRRPPSMCVPEAPFYLAINHNRVFRSYWYKAQALGEQSLRSIMKDMAEKANLPGRKTNHSARKTTCTKLLHAGVAPSVIQQLTGHKNIQSINNYAVASNDMQRDMSNILSDADRINTNCVPVPDASPAAQQLQQRPSTSFSSYQQRNSASLSSRTCQISGQYGQILPNATMTNCQITINNTYSSSPRPSSRSPRPNPRKRLRIIDTDSDSD